MANKKTIIALACCVFLLGSCGFKDIDKRLFVVAIGFDQSKTSYDKLLIHLKIAIPKGDPRSINQEFDVVTVESKTIAEALRRAKSMVDKELDYGHTKILVVGEKIARTNIKQIADWSSRRRDVQLIAVLTVGKPSALDVIKLKPRTERVPGNAIFLALTKDGTESPFINPEYVFDFNRRLTEVGMDPYLPIIQVNKDKYDISTVALLNKEKVVMTLNPDESRLFNLLRGKEKMRTNLTVRTDSNTYELNIDHTSAKYSIESGNGRTTIKYAIKLRGALEEKVSVEETSYRQQKEIEAAGEEALNKQVEALLRKFQDHHVDPLGFGLHYYARHWNNQTKTEQWKKIYDNVKFEANSNIKLKYSEFIM